MKRVGFGCDEACLSHEPPPWHPDGKARLTAILSPLQASGLRDRVLQLKPRRASLKDITRVHRIDYIELIRTSRAAELEQGTYVSEGSFEAALHAT